MKKVVELLKTISLPPCSMNEHIIKNIIYLLKTKYEKICSEDDGLIVSIDDIIDISNIISKDSCSILCSVRFNASVIKPEKNSNISFKPSLILTKGIFGKVFDNINLFVPESNLTKRGWKFANDTFEREQQKVTKDSTIDVTVTDIKFNISKYNCICILD